MYVKPQLIQKTCVLQIMLQIFTQLADICTFSNFLSGVIVRDSFWGLVFADSLSNLIRSVSEVECGFWFSFFLLLSNSNSLKRNYYVKKSQYEPSVDL